MTKTKIHLDNYLERISEGHFTVPYSTVIRLLDAANDPLQQATGNPSLSQHSPYGKKTTK